ncbi:glycoside hydrolase family 28 protein [Piloderma croceum F 1598]|uniref:endo-polygalacturonase n=1 Tax=Piloderma croceum (strain F 1598) TaxID=765440 RepID=A0A0C3CI84_PILCF|nr:glycoside hydrolase family 28 protein [Piloderma croceum F 1598]
MLRLPALFSTVLLARVLISAAAPTHEPASSDEVHMSRRCTATIRSAADITSANLACSTINIESFTMTAGKTLALSGLSNGATVNLLGDITFGFKNWAGPLFEISSNSGNFTFNGNGKTLNGQGVSYWDGKGLSAGVTKPDPMVVIGGGGIFKDVTVLNSPGRAVAVSNAAPMIISGVTIDNSAGKSLGANTDCFDVAGSDVTITGNTCKNQDDCLAVNYGSNIKFSSNFCTGGHGISIGSISSGSTVSDVTISDNTVTDSFYGLRIKTDEGATDASVTNIVYLGNTVSGITYQGVAILQDYKNGSPSGTASNGVTLGPITFSYGNSVSVDSQAQQVYVLCGELCTGAWDWSGLKTSGGAAGSSNYAKISGYNV